MSKSQGRAAEKRCCEHTATARSDDQDIVGPRVIDESFRRRTLDDIGGDRNVGMLVDGQMHPHLIREFAGVTLHGMSQFFDVRAHDHPDLR